MVKGSVDRVSSEDEVVQLALFNRSALFTGASSRSEGVYSPLSAPMI